MISHYRCTKHTTETKKLIKLDQFKHELTPMLSTAFGHKLKNLCAISMLRLTKLTTKVFPQLSHNALPNISTSNL